MKDEKELRTERGRIEEREGEEAHCREPRERGGGGRKGD